ncbi:hypothetical protein Dimus_023208 [Dionaea muscipula]
MLYVPSSVFGCCFVCIVAFLVAAVDTQPPSARDRGRKLMPSPVAQYALDRGFLVDPIFTPERVNEETILSSLRSLHPELCITAAYGNILPSKFLKIPAQGCAAFTSRAENPDTRASHWLAESTFSLAMHSPSNCAWESKLVLSRLKKYLEFLSVNLSHSSLSFYLNIESSALSRALSLIRAKRKQRIISLLDGSGNWVSDESGIQTLVLDFYGQLFSSCPSPCVAADPVCIAEGQTLSEEQRALLVAEFSEQGIKDAIRGISGGRETLQASWISTYMDHLMARRLVNPPRVMMRHMSYVISMKDHESPYGDRLTLVFEAFGVPLVIKKGEEPKKYDFFEDTFLTMCKLTRENGVWWIGSGENRRRDDDIDVPAEEEAEKEEENQTGFDWEAVIDEAATEGESGSGEKFYDAEDENQGSPEVQEEIPSNAPSSLQARR